MSLSVKHVSYSKIVMIERNPYTGYNTSIYTAVISMGPD